MSLPFKTSAVDPTAPIGDHLQSQMPAPLLFNPWKHHAGFLRQQVELAAARGETGLEELAQQLLVTGSELMDLYLGVLSPGEIGAELLTLLRASEHLEMEPFREWITAGKGYQQLPLSDSSVWVLRLGAEGERYIHTHPGRWVPQTRRVRAPTLRTAVLLLAHTILQPGDPLALATVNHVRQRYLGLSPVGEVSPGQGLAAVLADLGKLSA